ncbi:MAG: hypothetical protein J6X91_04455 [Bacteroidales bacterium]|nr:hypothetical protein [Bacteroidales bacterium]
MKRYVLLASMVLVCAAVSAQVKIKDAKALPLKAELVADLADWTLGL